MTRRKPSLAARVIRFIFQLQAHAGEHRPGIVAGGAKRDLINQLLAERLVYAYGRLVLGHRHRRKLLRVNPPDLRPALLTLHGQRAGFLLFTQLHVFAQAASC